MIDLVRNHFKSGEVIGRIEKLPSNDFWIECEYHNYVTLYYGNQFIYCLDNSMYKVEEIIEKIEKRTRKKFSEIPINGNKDDFQGLLWLADGWRGDFWEKVIKRKH